MQNQGLAKVKSVTMDTHFGLQGVEGQGKKKKKKRWCCLTNFCFRRSLSQNKEVYHCRILFKVYYVRKLQKIIGFMRLMTDTSGCTVQCIGTCHISRWGATHTAVQQSRLYESDTGMNKSNTDIYLCCTYCVNIYLFIGLFLCYAYSLLWWHVVATTDGTQVSSMFSTSFTNKSRSKIRGLMRKMFENAHFDYQLAYLSSNIWISFNETWNVYMSHVNLVGPPTAQ